jgi:hypothetical protein
MMNPVRHLWFGEAARRRWPSSRPLTASEAPACPSRSSRGWGGAAALLLLLSSGCTDRIPTASDPSLIPVDAETFTVELPFEAFAGGLRVDGGYGSTRDLPSGILARGSDGSEARTLVRWGPFPVLAPVPPAGGGEILQDSLWTAVGGDLVLRIDSLRYEGGDEIRLRADRLLEPYDPTSARWGFAVDTLGNRVAWSTAGGGATQFLNEGVWLRAQGDSLVLPLDSAQAAAFTNRDELYRSLLLRSDQEGVYLRVFSAALRLRVRPSVRPDTTVLLQPIGTEISFIHSAEGASGADDLVVGGVPAFRSAFQFRLPTSVTVSGSACGGLPTCSVELKAERLIYAGLVLTSTQPGASILVPQDTVRLDLRPVLAPTLLPRSPLGLPLSFLAKSVAPEAFAGAAGQRVEVPVTRFLRDLLTPPGEGQDPSPTWVSLMGGVEPSELGRATFAGPGTLNRPRLRLILTRSEGVTLP